MTDDEHLSGDYQDYSLQAKFVENNKSWFQLDQSKVQNEIFGKPTSGISVDGACSSNPGPCEYRGVDVGTGKVLFSAKIAHGTNNVAEFVGLVHALMLCHKKGQDCTVYSDSVTAISWVKKKAVNCSLPRNIINQQAWEMMDRCINWLKTTDKISPIEKWETKMWGEIPADFGRK